jgi:hypothetical protein
MVLSSHRLNNSFLLPIPNTTVVGPASDHVHRTDTFMKKQHAILVTEFRGPLAASARLGQSVTPIAKAADLGYRPGAGSKCRKSVGCRNSD